MPDYTAVVNDLGGYACGGSAYSAVYQASEAALYSTVTCGYVAGIAYNLITGIIVNDK